MVGPVTVHKQHPPKKKGAGMGSVVILRGASSEMMLYLRDGAAKWKLPLVELTLRGKFVKEQWTDKMVLACDELIQPDSATEWPADEIKAEEGKPTLKACLDAGLRAADYVTKKEAGHLAAAAFSFAAQAVLQGTKLE